MHKHLHWITLVLGMLLGYFALPTVVGFIQSKLAGG